MTVMMLLLRRKSVIGDLVSGPVYLARLETQDVPVLRHGLLDDVIVNPELRRPT